MSINNVKKNWTDFLFTKEVKFFQAWKLRGKRQSCVLCKKQRQVSQWGKNNSEKFGTLQANRLKHVLLVSGHRIRFTFDMSAACVCTVLLHTPINVQQSMWPENVREEKDFLLQHGNPLWFRSRNPSGLSVVCRDQGVNTPAQGEAQLWHVSGSLSSADVPNPLKSFRTRNRFWSKDSRSWSHRKNQGSVSGPTTLCLSGGHDSGAPLELVHVSAHG